MQIFVEHRGIICNFTPIFNIGGMNLDHNFFQVSKLSNDQKTKVFTKNGTLFSPNSSGDLRSDAHQSQIIGGDADEDHTQIIGGDISLPAFGTPDRTRLLTFESDYMQRYA